MGRSALFFNRIVQKSIKMGGYLINFPFLRKKKWQKSLALQEKAVSLQQVLRKVNDRLIVNLFSLFFLRKRGEKEVQGL